MSQSFEIGGDEGQEVPRYNSTLQFCFVCTANKAKVTGTKANPCLLTSRTIIITPNFIILKKKNITQLLNIVFKTKILPTDSCLCHFSLS